MALFHWVDYILCAISLSVSIAIGIFYGIKTGNNTAEEFLVAGRNLQIIPVSLSIFVTWLSAISFIGDPVEVYYHGAVYMFAGVGYVLALSIVAHIFAPALNSMKLISAYEYMETRYNKAARIFVSLVSIISGCLYTALVIYAPSVALSQVTGLQEWISIILIGSVGTFYTTLGGIKAVVWADALQSLIMFTAIVAVIIQGLITVGGIQVVWEIAKRGERLNFLENSWSPFVRSTACGYVLSGFFRVFLPYITAQRIIQRYLTLPTRRATTIAVYLNIPMYAVFCCSFTLIGLTMYAYYEGCDPLLQGRINRPDQLIPLFMLDMLGFLPGLSGVFLASLFAAALSTMSSFINSAATNVAKDFIEPIYFKYKHDMLSDRAVTNIAKFTTLIIGMLVTSLAFTILYIKVNVFSLTNRISGLMDGPVGAMFICGICCAFVKTWSMFLASAIGLIICLWLGIGSLIYAEPKESLPTSVVFCESNHSSVDGGNENWMNITFNNTSGITDIINRNTTSDSPLEIYNLSFLLFAAIGCILTVFIAIALSVPQLIYYSCLSKKHHQKKNFTLLSTNDKNNIEMPEVEEM